MSNDLNAHTLSVTEEEVAAITAKFEKQKLANRNMNALLEMRKKAGNHICADCGDPDPDWGSHNLGIFICTNCAVIHRGMGTHISKVKSIKLDFWEDEHVKKVREVGNHASNVAFEKLVPLCYRKPKRNDCWVLREQWIRAKYEREEFIHPDRQIYTSGHLEMNMWKKGKEDERFQVRKFVLNAFEDTVKYYIKESQKEPKATIRISELNATFAPEKIGNPNGLQMSYVKDGSTRNVFVYTEDGKDIVNWYLAIRSAKLNRLHVAFPGANELELATRLTRDFAKEGWLSKTGPREGDNFRRRWFSLDDRKLMYMESPLAAYARGEIFLGHANDGFFVVRGSGPGSSREVGDPHGPLGSLFTLRTPTRTYLMRAENLEERGHWVTALEKVLEKPLTPQDSSMSALLVRKRQSTTSYLLGMLKTS